MSIYEIGILSAFLTLLLNYCIGKPGSDFSATEIFSKYTVFLSQRRLKKAGLYLNYLQMYGESLRDAETKHQKLTVKRQFHEMIYNAAAPFFTWEKAVGMCSICTGVWISLATGLVFTQKFLDLLIIVVISHVAIRILNKLL